MIIELILQRKTDEYKSTSKDLIEGFVHLFGQQEFSFDRFWANSRQRYIMKISPEIYRIGKFLYND